MIGTAGKKRSAAPSMPPTKYDAAMSAAVMRNASRWPTTSRDRKFGKYQQKKTPIVATPPSNAAPT